jgi:hypothetical protein
MKEPKEEKKKYIEMKAPYFGLTDKLMKGNVQK